MFSAVPDKIKCTLTADNILKSVHYENEQMDLIGDKEEYKELKTFQFESKESSGPGELRVVVENKQDDGHCGGSAGFLLQCEAKNGAGEVGMVIKAFLSTFEQYLNFFKLFLAAKQSGKRLPYFSVSSEIDRPKESHP